MTCLHNLQDMLSTKNIDERICKSLKHIFNPQKAKETTSIVGRNTATPAFSYSSPTKYSPMRRVELWSGRLSSVGANQVDQSPLIDRE